MKNQLNTNTRKLSGNRPGFVAPPKYEQENIIGTGGMKTVIRVHDADTGRSVALAVAKKFSSGTASQFTREALLTASLEHPNIVPVHEIGTTADGIPYFTMKLLSGETLQEIIDKLRKGDRETILQYPLGSLLSIFLKICDGVAFAHSRGVYHLDLKPANIQVGKFGEVLVLDWGLARTAGTGTAEDPPCHDNIPFKNSCETQDGVVRGTPEYMAPEQALGRNRLRGPKWDIYALGGILHAILTLHPPVEDTGNRREMFRRVVSGQLYGIRHDNFFKVPASLQFIMYKAMDRRPVMRYDSVPELKQDVERYLSGYPALAEKAGFYTKAILFFKRERNQFFMGLSLFFFFFMLLALTSARLYYKRLELDIYRHTARMRENAEQRRKNLENRLYNEAARRWQKINHLPAKVPCSEFRIAYSLRWNGKNTPFTLCLDPVIKQEGLVFCFSPEKGTVSILKGRNKQLLREDFFVFAPGNDYNILLEGHPADNEGRISLSLSVDHVSIFTDLVPDFYAPPGKADIRFVSDSTLCLSDFSASELGIPLKTDLLNLAGYFLRRGDFKIASELFRTTANAAVFPEEKKKALFMAEEVQTLQSFIPQLPDTEKKLKRICRTEHLTVRIEGNCPALIVHGGIFPADPFLEKLPLRVLRLKGTKIPSPSFLSGFRLRRLEVDRCKLSDLPALNRELLQNVILTGNPVADLTPLKDLALQHLTVSDGKIRDLSPLSEMMTLRDLNLSGNQIISADPLQKLHLIRLNLDRNDIVSLNFLHAMDSLKEFSAADNRISSIAPIEGKEFLKLNLRGNPAANLKRPQTETF